MNGSDQYDIARGDVIVPDTKYLIAVIGRVFRSLENRSDVSFLKNVWERDQITSMNFKTFLPTCFANVSSVTVSLSSVCFCIEICSFQSRC